MRDKHPGRGQVSLVTALSQQSCSEAILSRAVGFPSFFAEKRLLSIPCDVYFSLSYGTYQTVKPSCLALGLQ